MEVQLIDTAAQDEQKVVDAMELGEIPETGKPSRAHSHEESSSPKRQRKDEDSSVHSDQLSSSESDGSISSGVSDNDAPESVSEPADDTPAEEIYEHAYQDEGLVQALHQGLIALKASLTRKAANFEHAYTFFKVDEEVTDDFVGWVCENFIDWEKFAPSEEEKSKE